MGFVSFQGPGQSLPRRSPLLSQKARVQTNTQPWTTCCPPAQPPHTFICLWSLHWCWKHWFWCPIARLSPYKSLYPLSIWSLATCSLSFGKMGVGWRGGKYLSHEILLSIENVPIYSKCLIIRVLATYTTFSIKVSYDYLTSGRN